MKGISGDTELIMAGRYRRIRRLGTGGMARVFLAIDEVLGREVAIKQLPSSAPEEALARFRREARLGASLNHPGIVSIFDSVSDEDAVLIVMEYVEGESLAERLRAGRLDRAEAFSILEQVADALDHAHAHGVLHRDIKPSNVLLTTDGTAKIADLGIATAVDATAITGSGNVVGTLAYIAPERLRGEPGESAGDVYSLAAVAFEMLSGRRAHPERTPAELLRRLDEGATPSLLDADPGASPVAAAALERAMDPDPSRRPVSAEELVASLATRPVGEGDGGPPPTRRMRTEPPPFVPPPVSRRSPAPGRVAALAALAAAGALVVGALLLGGGADEARRAADEGTTTGVTTSGDEGGGQSGDGSAAEAGATAPAPPPAPQPEPEPAPPPLVEAGAAALNEQGFALIQAGRYAEAVPVLEQAVAAFPAGTRNLDYAYALFNLGSALRLAGRPEEAIPILEQRLEIPNQRGIVKRELRLAEAAAGIGGNPGDGEKGGGKKDDDDD